PATDQPMPSCQEASRSAMPHCAASAEEDDCGLPDAFSLDGEGAERGEEEMKVGKWALESLKRRLASSQRRKALVLKFGGTTSGSPPELGRVRDARKLIESKLAEGYFVVPVFSALKREPAEGRP